MDIELIKSSDEFKVFSAGYKAAKEKFENSGELTYITNEIDAYAWWKGVIPEHFYAAHR